MLDLRTSSRLLTIVARSLGYDYMSLRSELAPHEMCNAWFSHYDSYDTFIVKVDGKGILLKFVDTEGCLRSAADMFAELAGLLYKTLDNGGYVSDGMHKLSAEEVPEFMIECVLNGIY